MNPKALLIAVILLLCVPATALAWHGQVTSVTDGDTFEVARDGNEVTIRLYGIDCPEHDQPYGGEAELFVRDRIAGEQIRVEEVSIGRYGRTIALVYESGECLNTALVQNGLAWVYDRYCERSVCDQWDRLEDLARKRERGLWSSADLISPWEWRD